jgi:hypothetical protein
MSRLSQSPMADVDLVIGKADKSFLPVSLKVIVLHSIQGYKWDSSCSLSDY